MTTSGQTSGSNLPPRPVQAQAQAPAALAAQPTGSNIAVDPQIQALQQIHALNAVQQAAKHQQQAAHLRQHMQRLQQLEAVLRVSEDARAHIFFRSNRGGSPEDNIENFYSISLFSLYTSPVIFTFIYGEL